MLSHPVLDQLDAALKDAVPAATIDVRGAWSSRSRRTYESAAQLGSGSGPFVEVVDHLWDGCLAGSDVLTGMAFLQTPSALHWVKVASASPSLAVRVSLHAFASDTSGRMTFAAGLGGAFLPGVPVSASAGERGCVLAPAAVVAGRVACVARAEGAAFFVLPLPSVAVSFGRNRLWRLRDRLASRLPADVREMMTRRRAGVLPGPVDVHADAMRHRA